MQTSNNTLAAQVRVSGCVVSYKPRVAGGKQHMCDCVGFWRVLQHRRCALLTAGLAAVDMYLVHPCRRGPLLWRTHYPLHCCCNSPAALAIQTAHGISHSQQSGTTAAASTTAAAAVSTVALGSSSSYSGGAGGSRYEGIPTSFAEAQRAASQLSQVRSKY